MKKLVILLGFCAVFGVASAASNNPPANPGELQITPECKKKFEEVRKYNMQLHAAAEKNDVNTAGKLYIEKYKYMKDLIKNSKCLPPRPNKPM